jgi:hypothetical protein
LVVSFQQIVVVLGVSMTVESAAGIERPSHTRTQHAVRLLVLLDCCGESVIDGDPDATVKTVRSELRLQAMDFWMRNPDCWQI